MEGDISELEGMGDAAGDGVSVFVDMAGAGLLLNTYV